MTINKLELEIKELKARLLQEEMNQTLVGLLRKENSYLRSLLKVYLYNKRGHRFMFENPFKLNNWEII